MTESRQEFLARVAEEHYQWEEQQLPDATFMPNPEQPDYNLHYLDVSGTPEANDALASAVGPADYADDGSVPDESESLIPAEMDKEGGA